MSSARRNIGQDNRDSAFRYKMDVLQIKDEGRGNGVKTIIVNMGAVASQLGVPAEFPTKYYSFEMGVRTEYKENIGTVVYGRHTAQVLNNLLDAFIQEIVVCPKCKLPCESKFGVAGERLKRSCAACGHTHPMKPSHIVEFMVKKLASKKGGKKPKDKPEKDKPEKDKPEKDKPEKDKDKIERGNAGKGNKREKDSKPEVDNPADKIATKKPPKFKATAPPSESDFITGDTSKNAMAERREAEMNEMKVSEKEDNRRIGDPVELLRVFLATRSREPSELMSEMRRLELTRELDHRQKLKILLEVLIPSDPIRVVAGFESQLALLKPFVRDEVAQLHFICAVEQFIGEAHVELLPKLPLVLQALYVGDLVTEEVILQWSTTPEATWIVTKGAALKVRQKAAKFIKALQSVDGEEV